MPDSPAPPRSGVPGRRICLLVNPYAGRGRGETVGQGAARRLRALGHDVVVVDHTDPAVATSDVRTLLTDVDGDPRVDAVVVIGGDGSVHVALNATLRPSSDHAPGERLPLGIVPAGTGNDFARSLGLPADPVAAVDAIAADLARLDPRPIDVVSATGGPATGAAGGAATPPDPRWFAGVLSAGFDAVVSDRAGSFAWAPGATRYALAVARELPTYRPRRYRMDLDGEVWETDALLVSVANASTYGGGMRIAPDASVDDGALDVVVVRPLPRRRFVHLFPRVYAGRHLDLPDVEVRRAKRVAVSVVDEGRPLLTYADGEPLLPLPLTCEVRAAAVPVLGRPAEPEARPAAP